MCTAIFERSTLARTVDRVGSLREHRIEGTGDMIFSKILTPDGDVFIDGMNDRGLMTALLNFEKDINDTLHFNSSTKTGVHPARLIPLILEGCTSVKDAEKLLSDVLLTEDAPKMYPHYIICDRFGGCIIYENGRTEENPYGVLANAPSFHVQSANLSEISREKPQIPWSYTSESRFQRIAWMKAHGTRFSSPTDYMNLLDTVAVPEGMDPRKGYRTLIRSVMCAETGNYSWSTENNRSVRSVSLGTKGIFEIQ